MTHPHEPVTPFQPSHAERVAWASGPDGLKISQDRGLRKIAALLRQAEEWDSLGWNHAANARRDDAAEEARWIGSDNQQRLSGFTIRAAELPQGEPRARFWADVLAQLEQEQP